MQDAIIKLLFNLGTVGSVTIAIIWLWKPVLQPIFNKLLEVKLEKYKMEIQLTLNQQTEIMSRKLELEIVKLNKVIPILEDINVIITTHKSMFQSYMHSVINNGKVRENFENQRFELDKELFNKISKVSIYLPKEMRIILYEIRKIVSCSWLDTSTMYHIIRTLKLDRKEVAEKTLDIYGAYTSCFYDMFSIYCSLDNRKKDYKEVMIENGLDENGKFISEDLVYKFVETHFLFHEYISSNEMLEIQSQIESSNNLDIF